MSVLTRFEFFEWGLCMFCVACMIFAFEAAVKVAIALFFTSNNKSAERVRTCVF